MTLKSYLILPLLCLAAPAFAQGTSIADFGASADPNHDNTAAINRCIDAAAKGYFHCFKPPGVWHVKGSLRWDRETGQLGFGFAGPGIIMEDGDDLPIFVAAGVGGQAPFIEGNFQYAHYQGPEKKNSACIRIDLGTKDNSVYNGWISFQCTNAFRGIDQKLGAPWGMEFPWIDCKNNSGGCIQLFTNKDAAMPNNHFGHVYINPAATACGGDAAEVHIEFMTGTVIDNLEGNNLTCPLAFEQNNRGTIYRNVRFEHGFITDHKFAGHAIIEANDDGVVIEQIEVQTITVDVGGDFSVFHDAGWFGSEDRIFGSANILHSTLKSGHFYAVSAPSRIVHTVPFLLWYVNTPQDFSGQVAPGSLNVNP